MRHAVDDLTYERARRSKALLEGVAVGLEIYLPTRHACLDGCSSDRRRHPKKDAFVNGFGQDVVGAKAEGRASVGRTHAIGNALAGECRDGPCRRELHFVIDLASTDVER